MIYKSSNFEPNLNEIDALTSNVYSCQVNTSGEPVKAYSLDFLDREGNHLANFPEAAQNLATPVKNKGILKATRSLSSSLTNGRDYQWGIRTYNAQLVGTNSITLDNRPQPNTLITSGYLVGSTKNIIWSRIPSNNSTGSYTSTEKANGQTAQDQIQYDRYIEFSTNNASTVLSAKADELLELPADGVTFTQRLKIDYVTKDIGTDLDFVKIETVDPFTYDYKDGTSYSIYQCSSDHTVNETFADPNSNINVAHFIMIYPNAAQANAAKTAGDTPASMTVAQAPCMATTAGGSTYKARKITGYSSDTGSIRVNDSFAVPPENNQCYRIFEYDSTAATPYKAVDDANITTHIIGGTALINATYYKVFSNKFTNNSATDNHIFIQPNINIKSDATNPCEVVFNNGGRLQITKRVTTRRGNSVDITINPLDDTQWLLESTTPRLVSGTAIPADSRGNIQCQTDYSVYTDFMDGSPYSYFYARQTPTLTLQAKNYSNDNATYADIVTVLTQAIVSAAGWLPQSNVNYYFSEQITYPNDPQHPEESVTYSPGYYAWDATNSAFKISYPTFTWRAISFNTVWNSANKVNVKYYKYYLYHYNETTLAFEYLTESEEIYQSDIEWVFRGFETGERYKIYSKVVDEFGKEFQSDERIFNVSYESTASPVPLVIEQLCDEQAVKIQFTTPVYAVSTDFGLQSTVTDEDIEYNSVAKSNVLSIGNGQILNYTNIIADEGEMGRTLDFPSKSSVLTRLQLTSDFVDAIPTGRQRAVLEYACERPNDPTHMDHYVLRMGSFAGYGLNDNGKIVKNNNQYQLKLYKAQSNLTQVTQNIADSGEFIPAANVPYQFIEPISYIWGWPAVTIGQDELNIIGNGFIPEEDKLYYISGNGTDGKFLFADGWPPITVTQSVAEGSFIETSNPHQIYHFTENIVYPSNSTSYNPINATVSFENSRADYANGAITMSRLTRDGWIEDEVVNGQFIAAHYEPGYYKWDNTNQYFVKQTENWNIPGYYHYHEVEVQGVNVHRFTIYGTDGQPDRYNIGYYDWDVTTKKFIESDETQGYSLVTNCFKDTQGNYTRSYYNIFSEMAGVSTGEVLLKYFLQRKTGYYLIGDTEDCDSTTFPVNPEANIVYVLKSPITWNGNLYPAGLYRYVAGHPKYFAADISADYWQVSNLSDFAANGTTFDDISVPNGARGANGNTLFATNDNDEGQTPLLNIANFVEDTQNLINALQSIFITLYITIDGPNNTVHCDVQTTG